MAVPTISSIVPSTGLAWGGNLIAISGTNFRPDSTAVPATPLVSPSAASYPTVRVTINGRICPQAGAGTSTAIWARVPQSMQDVIVAAALPAGTARPSYPAVDVVVENLDDSGVLIPGETVTSIGGYTYALPVLLSDAGDSVEMQVVAALSHRLQREILPEVVLSAHTDYGVVGGTYVVLSRHPAIQIRCDIEDDPEYNWFDPGMQTFEVSPGIYDTYQAQRTIKIAFDLILSSEDPTEITRMCDAVLESQMMQPWLVVPSDSRHPNHPFENQYPLEMPTAPESVGSPNNANIYARNMKLEARGIPMMVSQARERDYLREILVLIVGQLNP